MTPSEHYQQAIDSGQQHDDPAQRTVLAVFDEVHAELLNGAHKPSLLHALFPWAGNTQPQRGIYLWGDVGRGKTWLMNLFYESLPAEQCQRQHFHRFMLDVHARLGEKKRQKNPLQQVAKDLATQYRVLCLDEFIVTNITDAMILYGLLDGLFRHGTVLVMTSNRVPDDLYLNGLQRERFLPAIELIRQHTRVLHLDGRIDHRLALLEQSDIYYTAVNGSTHEALNQRMQSLATDHIEYGKTMSVLKRPLQTVACADEIAWFEFDTLCNAPRAASDYLELARDYHTILLSDVPVMDAGLDDRARRFIYLIDALYDRRVKLILSAAAPPDQLYAGNMLSFPFKRTSSRLIEMRTEEYLSQPHRNET